MCFYLVACALLSYTAFGWKCGGVVDHISDLSPGVSYIRKSTQDSLRISWIIDEVDMGNCSHYLDDSISRVSNYFKNALKVNQIEGSLNLPGLQSCGAYSQISRDILTSGIPDSDVLIFIDTFNDSSLNYLARAGACAVDPGNLNQVLAGYISINSEEYHKSLTDETSLFTVLLHEVIHILGFSRNLMKFWKTKDRLGYNLASMTNTTTLRGIPKTVLITPSALSAARAHTGCSSYPGLELEEYENSFIAKNHIDGFFSIHDVMSYTVTLDIYPSIYVAAILEDVGHFTVNPEYFFEPPWQKYVGCKFITLKCLKENYSKYPDFVCDENNPDGCDVSGVFRSKCEIDENIGDVKSYYRNFLNQKFGGPPFADFCPIYKTSDLDTCWGSTNPTDITSEYGEQTGPDSVCMMSTIYRLPVQTTTRHSACFRVLRCSTTGTKVQIGDTTVNCPLAGGQISVPGYNGILECPPANNLCKDRPCYHACLGQGRCIMGRCECNPGFSGPDCSIVCFPGCKTCLSSLASDCLTCLKENFVPTAGGCSCPQNFTINAQAECVRAVKCINCEKCVNNVCVECKKNFTIVGCECVCDKGYKMSGNGNCDSCLNGYYQKDEKCLQCPNPCFTCKDNNVCTSCLDGYFLVGSQCMSSEACLESWSGYCLKCKPGYSLINGICEECMTGCLVCTSKVECTTCSGDFVLLSNSCQCHEKCADCDYINFKCRVCKTQYYLSNGLCLNCKPSCKNCICPSKCTECLGVFELSYDGGCSCPASCSECNYLDYTCVSCNPGFFLENNRCTKCPPSCETCTSLTKCLTCRGSYSLQSNFTCECAESCLYCDRFDFSCLLCKEKYYFELGKCFPCVSPCEKCYSAQNCSSCISPLILNEQNRCTCQQTCAKCEDSLGCIKCFQGFYLSGQECKRCIDPCKVCTGPNQCQDCLGHYLPYVDGKCQCPKCCVCDSGTYFCRAPIEGYFLTNSGCSKCADQCKTCIRSSVTCTSCKGSLQLIGSECAWPLKCTKIDLTTFECVQCEPNYVLDPTTKQCIKCGVGCSCCFDNGGNCITCKGIFEINPNKTSECICPLSKCKQCNSTTYLCQECHPGSTLLNGNCESCNPICSECNNSTRSCTKCKGVFELESGMCLCPKTCKQCNYSTYTCSQCYDGYYLNNLICSACASPCKTCNGTNTTCTSCFNKYTLSNKTCNCPENCMTCDMKMYSCTGCKTGYVLIDGICKPCISPCKTCIENPNTCTSCYGSAVLEATTCICSKTCKSCNSNTLQCDSCKEGYYLNNSVCTPCHLTCKECSGSTSSNCTLCFNTYKLDKGVCIKPNNCEIGDPVNFICSNCSAGYFIKNGECLKCNPRCKTCQSREDICLSCQGNLRQVNSKCEDPEGCLNFVNYTTCTSCSRGFVLINGTCNRCLYPCLTCVNKTDVCTSCSDAFNLILNKCNPQSSCLSIIPSSLLCGVCSDEYYIYQGFCLSCKSPCKRCLSHNFCLSCIPNYELNPETGACTYLPQCIIRDPLTSRCQVCRDGTYLSDGQRLGDGDGECHYCTSSCRTCDGSPTKCTSCFSDFQVNIRAQCCPRSCSFCYLGSETCRECIDGFYLTNGRCFQCELPCRTCNSDSVTCTSCMGSYVLENKQCVCPSQCNECSCFFLCTSCKSKYYLENGSCLSCSKNCKMCSQYNFCSACESGFILDQGVCSCPQGTYLNSTSCIECNKTCTTCIGPNNCTSCVESYYLNKTTCLACSSNCLVCNGTNNCTKCKVGFISVNGLCTCDKGTYLEGSSCVSCAQGCNNCTGISKCLTCNKGYYLDVGLCKLCINNCTACTTQTICSECASGYYLNKNLCAVCTVNCSSCTTLTNCSSCKAGFYLDKNTCKSCPSNCLKCSGTSCDECNTDYQLNSTKQCNYLPTGCSIYDASKKKCSVCDTQYELCLDGTCKLKPRLLKSQDNRKDFMCHEGCHECKQYEMCDLCYRGYWNDDKACRPCLTGCDICKDSVSCEICEFGYVMNSWGICEECSKGCLKCDEKYRTCTMCRLGWALDDGLCINCGERCRSCGRADDCLECEPGYVKINGRCNQQS